MLYSFSPVPKFNFKKACFICGTICSIEPHIKYPDHWWQNPVFCVKQLKSLRKRDIKEESKRKEEGKGGIKWIWNTGKTSYNITELRPSTKSWTAYYN